jgi:uncharacterized protein (TIGR00251 family)
MTLELKTTRDGAQLEVLVAPRASKERILGTHDGALKVALTAPPVDGEANAALCAYLASRLHVAKSAVRIVRGQTSKRKTVEIAGVAAADLHALVEGGDALTRSKPG